MVLAIETSSRVGATAKAMLYGPYWFIPSKYACMVADSEEQALLHANSRDLSLEGCKFRGGKTQR